MRFAVQNPGWIFKDQEKNFNGYNFEFIKKYCSVIFLYLRPWNYYKYKKKLKELGWDKKICFTTLDANKKADVLICFNGKPYKMSNRPCKGFKGLKFYHVMDYSDRTSDAARCLRKGNVDYLLGYCSHDRYSGFFNKYFSDYKGRVISVPFGYGKRFLCIKSFNERKNKCIALGSVNPVRDPLMKRDALEEYIEYYKAYEYSHEVRKTISDNRDNWSDEIDCLLPVYPETKNNNYNAVEILNEYTMFVNDASIDSFPPARTYEGIACGAVMVAENLPVYQEIGFRDGVNCILFNAGDYQDMLSKIKFYKSNAEKLREIQTESLKLAEGFTHKKIADLLFQKIQEIAASKE